MVAERALAAEEVAFGHSLAKCPACPQNMQRFFSWRRFRSSEVSLPSFPSLELKGFARGAAEAEGGVLLGARVLEELLRSLRRVFSDVLREPEALAEVLAEVVEGFGCAADGL